MNIAIVKLSALGDIVHAMIILQFIKKAHPQAQIDWFVEERFAPVLQHNPHLRNIYAIKLKGQKIGLLSEYQKLKKIARLNRYDCVIDLQGLIKSAIVARTLSKNCVGFDKNSLRESMAAWFYTTSYAIDYSENVIKRNLLLVSKALSFSMQSCDPKEPFLFSQTSSDLHPHLLIVVGSSWESKIYPKEHFVTLINALNVPTYISWGNDKEKADAQFIEEHSHAVMLPKVSLDTLKAIIKNSALVIGADSGPTHMAWALNRPSITIFGPTPSERNTLTTHINRTIDCHKSIDAKRLNKQDMCIKSIDPEKIILLAKELLAC